MSTSRPISILKKSQNEIRTIPRSLLTEPSPPSSDDADDVDVIQDKAPTPPPILDLSNEPTPPPKVPILDLSNDPSAPQSSMHDNKESASDIEIIPNSPKPIAPILDLSPEPNTVNKYSSDQVANLVPLFGTDVYNFLGISDGLNTNNALNSNDGMYSNNRLNSNNALNEGK